MTAATTGDTPLLSPAVSALLDGLSKASTAQLGLLILQQPHLPRLVPRVLQILATAALSHDLAPPGGLRDFENILSLLEHAASSEDPSLPRRLLPPKDAVIYLCLLATREQSLRLRSLLPSLTDAATTDELLIAAIEACRAAPSRSPTQLSRTVRIVSALLRHLPTTGPPVKGRVPKPSDEHEATQAKVDELIGILTTKYHQIGSSQSKQALSSKVHMLDAACAYLERLLESGQSQRLASSLVLLASNVSVPMSSSSSASSQVLLDLPLFLDLLLSRPVIMSPIRASLSAPGPSFPDDKLRQTALAALELAESTVRPIAACATQEGEKRNLISLGGGWDLLIQEMREARQEERQTNLLASQTSTSKGKAKEPPHHHATVELTPSLVVMLEAILPQLASDRDKLSRILSRQKFFGKGEEEVIQMLLDEDLEVPDEVVETQSARLGGLSLHDRASPIDPAQSAPPSTDLNGKMRRANIFNDQPLDSTRLRWKDQEADLDLTSAVQPVSSSLKSQILARVSAQTAEEEAALRGEEWNPFSVSSAQEVGFEEELDEGQEEDERLTRRRGIAQLGGEHGNARDWRRRLEDLSDDEGSDDEGEGNQQQRGGPGPSENASTMSIPPSGDGAASERTADRLLILAYSQHGPTLFTRDAASRKSAQRKELKKDLEAKTGRAWDDALVESWGTMFERNPRKDSLLSSAASHSLLSGGNPNLNTASPAPPALQYGERGYGPDRGRGGRVPRGGDGGRGGTGGRGRGRGGGGHSGNDRGAKNKERRGNAARTRGADRKARLMGGPGAGV